MKLKKRLIVVPAVLAMALAAAHTTTGYAVDAGVGGIGFTQGGAGNLSSAPQPAADGAFVGAQSNKVNNGNDDIVAECSVQSQPDLSNPFDTIVATGIASCYLCPKSQSCPATVSYQLIGTDATTGIWVEGAENVNAFQSLTNSTINPDNYRVCVQGGTVFSMHLSPVLDSPIPCD